MFLPTGVTLMLICWSAQQARGDHYHPERPTGAAGRSGTQPDAAERTAAYWVDEALTAIQQRRARWPSAARARNVVMFLGDGMSVPTLAAARTLLGQRRGRPGEEAQLSFEAFPTVGLSKTYCVNQQIADSACTATAYLCGVKNNYGTLGVTAAVPRRDCAASAVPANRLSSIAEWALEDGKDVGIVTTTRVTHASPAGAYAKTADRNWEHDALVKEAGHDTERCPDIAHQLVHMHPGKDFKVILGGGRRNFLPNTTRDEEGTRGRRTDNRNLIQEWQDDKRERNLSYAYAWNRDQLMSQMESPPEYLLGLFESSHLQYHLEANDVTEPTLTELTEIAIRSLSRNEKGFFLFVEGGRIDHAHHDNLVHLALDETIQLSEAVARAAELLPEEESLLVLTADHAHVMAFNGYTHRGSDILGPSNDLDDNDVPYMTLSYTNGPGARAHEGTNRTNVLEEHDYVTADHAHVMAFNGYTRRGGDVLGPSDQLGDDGVPYMTLSYANGPGARTQANAIRPNVLHDANFGVLQWRTHAEMPLASETHGGDDVAVFARGPQHAMFAGLYEQSQLPHVMAYAGCFGAAAAGAGQLHCDAAHPPTT